MPAPTALGGPEPVTAGGVRAHRRPRRANVANYFPLPGTSAALSVPIHLNFPLSAICLLNNTPPHFPTIPYPCCLARYSHGLTMALPKHNCLLWVWSLSAAPAAPPPLPAPSPPAEIRPLIALGLVAGVSETHWMLRVKFGGDEV